MVTRCPVEAENAEVVSGAVVGSRDMLGMAWVSAPSSRVLGSIVSVSWVGMGSSTSRAKMQLAFPKPFTKYEILDFGIPLALPLRSPGESLGLWGSCGGGLQRETVLTESYGFRNRPAADAGSAGRGREDTKVGPRVWALLKCRCAKFCDLLLPNLGRFTVGVSN